MNAFNATACVFLSQFKNRRSDRQAHIHMQPRLTHLLGAVDVFNKASGC